MKTRIGVTLSIVLMAVALTGCPQRRSIAEINQDPARYHERDVTVAGRVVNSYGALGQGIYEVDDGTGRMWVYSENGVPGRGAEVGTTGRVVPTFTFGGRSYATVLREKKRKVRTRR